MPKIGGYTLFFFYDECRNHIRPNIGIMDRPQKVLQFFGLIDKWLDLIAIQTFKSLQGIAQVFGAYAHGVQLSHICLNPDWLVKKDHLKQLSFNARKCQLKQCR